MELENYLYQELDGIKSCFSIDSNYKNVKSINFGLNNTWNVCGEDIIEYLPKFEKFYFVKEITNDKYEIHFMYPPVLF